MINNYYWRDFVSEIENVVDETLSPLILNKSNSTSSIFLFQFRYQIKSAFSKVCRNHLCRYIYTKDYFGTNEFNKKDILKVLSLTPSEIRDWLNTHTTKNSESLYYEAYQKEILPLFFHYKTYQDLYFLEIKISDLEKEIFQRINNKS